MNNPKLVLFLLRIGIASVFLYAGIAAFLHPGDWTAFFPPFFSKVAPITTVLFFFSVVELLLAIWLIIGWKVVYAAIVSAFMAAGIIGTNLNALDITFRDFTIFFAAIALAVATYKKPLKTR